jgi:hypothetical protein
MLKDWRDGDFELPPLAKIHVEHIEEKYLEVGKALRADNEAWEKFQREVLHPNTKVSHAHPKTSNDGA